MHAAKKPFVLRVANEVAPAMNVPGSQGQERIYGGSARRGDAPVARDHVVDEDQHLKLGQLFPGTRVDAVPKWDESVRPRRHLHRHRAKNKDDDQQNVNFLNVNVHSIVTVISVSSISFARRLEKALKDREFVSICIQTHFHNVIK
jgi:hypothetical protein